MVDRSLFSRHSDDSINDVLQDEEKSRPTRKYDSRGDDKMKSHYNRTFYGRHSRSEGLTNGTGSTHRYTDTSDAFNGGWQGSYPDRHSNERRYPSKEQHGNKYASSESHSSYRNGYSSNYGSRGRPARGQMEHKNAKYVDDSSDTDGMNQADDQKQKPESFQGQPKQMRRLERWSSVPNSSYSNGLPSSAVLQFSDNVFEGKGFEQPRRSSSDKNIWKERMDFYNSACPQTEEEEDEMMQRAIAESEKLEKERQCKLLPAATGRVHLSSVTEADYPVQMSTAMKATGNRVGLHAGSVTEADYPVRMSTGMKTTSNGVGLHARSVTEADYPVLTNTATKATSNGVGSNSAVHLPAATISDSVSALDEITLPPNFTLALASLEVDDEFSEESSSPVAVETSAKLSSTVNAVSETVTAATAHVLPTELPADELPASSPSVASRESATSVSSSESAEYQPPLGPVAFCQSGTSAFKSVVASKPVSSPVVVEGCAQRLRSSANRESQVSSCSNCGSLNFLSPRSANSAYYRARSTTPDSETQSLDTSSELPLSNSVPSPYRYDFIPSGTESPFDYGDALCQQQYAAEYDQCETLEQSAVQQENAITPYNSSGAMMPSYPGIGMPPQPCYHNSPMSAAPMMYPCPPALPATYVPPVPPCYASGVSIVQPYAYPAYPMMPSPPMMPAMGMMPMAYPAPPMPVPSPCFMQMCPPMPMSSPAPHSFPL